MLRQYMLEQHPDSIVPMLPALPKTNDIDDEKNLMKCGELLVQFLEQCFLSPSLKYDKMMSHFVTKSDATSTFVEVFKEDERPRHIG